MNILVVEDEADFAESLRSALAEAGHDVEVVGRARQALFRASSLHFDVFITNVLLPDWDGLKCVEALALATPRLPVLVWSGMRREYYADRLQSMPNVVGTFDKLQGTAPVVAAVAELDDQPDLPAGKLARIVCTLGPSSNDRATLGRMLLAGMDVARFNFSHGTHDEQAARLQALREASEEWSRPVAVLQDLCGPKIRLGEVEGGGVEIVKGNTLRLLAAPGNGTAERISINTPEILSDLRKGDPVLLDDGNLELEVVDPGEEEVVCRVVVGGAMRSRKGVNLPATNMRLPSVTEKDWADLEWGIAHNVDYVALSFVRTAVDIVQVKDRLRDAGSPARVVAKIEKPEALLHLDAILDVADAVMVARGDLGVEVRAERVPWIQRDIIRRCMERRLPVITATQMLESMTHNPRPTRAEATDVSIAILDGSDAVMLSGETAAGEYPVQAVSTMAALIRESEAHLRHSRDGADGLGLLPSSNEVEDALNAGALLADVNAIMVMDICWDDVLPLPKLERTKPVLFVTDDWTLYRQSCLWHGVVPIHLDDVGPFSEVGAQAIAAARDLGALRAGDLVAVLEHRDSPSTALKELGALHIVCVGE
ncbi:MAG: pyruvate kinase [Planctomycetota bacterium]